MRKSRFTEAQIIGMIKEQEAGMPTAEVCRRHGLSTATFYKLKAKYGGMEVSEAARLKALVPRRRPPHSSCRLIKRHQLSSISLRRMDRDLRNRATDRRSARPPDPPRQHPRDEWRELQARAKSGPKRRPDPVKNRDAHLSPPLGLRPPGGLKRARKWPAFAPPRGRFLLRR